MNSNDIKKLSVFLTQNLKDKEVKQSTLLELMAQYEGFADWNTLTGVEKNNVLPEKGWTHPWYVHVDNGGYTFSYHEKKGLLKIETGFFGYSINTHVFSFSRKDLKNFLKLYKQWYELISDEDREDEFESSFFPEKSVKSVFRFNYFNISFEDEYSSVCLGNNTEEVHAFFNSL